MKKHILFFILIGSLLGCNSLSNDSPVETMTEFLNSIHQGDFTKSRTFVQGKLSNQSLDELEELWRVNQGSFVQNPNYTITLESEEGNKSLVRVKDEFNDFKFQLVKVKDRFNFFRSWKIVMRSAGLIDLVRGNTRMEDANSQDYTIEVGDNGENNSKQEFTDSQTEEYNTDTSTYNDSDNNGNNRNSSSSQNTVEVDDPCLICNGVGVIEKCFICKNKGVINCVDCKGQRVKTDGRTCIDCRGTGIQTCYKCYGKKPPFVCPHNMFKVGSLSDYVLESKSR